MKTLFTLLFACVLASSAQSSAWELFVAATFTKDQRNTSEPTDAGVLLYRGGDSWDRVGPQILIVNSAAASPARPQQIFLAAGNGILRTLDGGRTWRMTTGWEVNDAMALAIDPVDARLVYAATAWGQWRSRDGGESWEAANQGLAEHYSQTIALDSANSRRLLLGTSAGLYESTNQARSWRRIQSVPAVPISRVRQSAADARLWIAGSEGGGVWLSRDGGRRWENVLPALNGTNVHGVDLHPSDPLRMAAGAWGHGVWISTDGGRSWRQEIDALPSPNVMMVRYDRSRPGRLWVSTFEEGTFATEDDGVSFSEERLYGANVRDVGFLPVRSQP